MADQRDFVWNDETAQAEIERLQRETDAIDEEIALLNAESDRLRKQGGMAIHTDNEISDAEIADGGTTDESLQPNQLLDHSADAINADTSNVSQKTSPDELLATPGDVDDTPQDPSVEQSIGDTTITDNTSRKSSPDQLANSNESIDKAPQEPSPDPLLTSNDDIDNVSQPPSDDKAGIKLITSLPPDTIEIFSSDTSRENTPNPDDQQIDRDDDPSFVDMSIWTQPSSLRSLVNHPDFSFNITSSSWTDTSPSETTNQQEDIDDSSDLSQSEDAVEEIPFAPQGTSQMRPKSSASQSVKESRTIVIPPPRSYPANGWVPKQIQYIEGSKELQEFPSHLSAQLLAYCQREATNQPSFIKTKWPRPDHLVRTQVGGNPAWFETCDTGEELLQARYEYGIKSQIIVVQAKPGSKSNFNKGRAAMIAHQNGGEGQRTIRDGHWVTQGRWNVWDPFAGLQIPVSVWRMMMGKPAPATAVAPSLHLKASTSTPLGLRPVSTPALFTQISNDLKRADQLLEQLDRETTKFLKRPNSFDDANWRSNKITKLTVPIDESLIKPYYYYSGHNGAERDKVTGEILMYRKTDGVLVALRCTDCDYKGFETQKGLSGHMRNVHKYNISGLDDVVRMCATPVQGVASKGVASKTAPITLAPKPKAPLQPPSVGRSMVGARRDPTTGEITVVRDSDGQTVILRCPKCDDNHWTSEQGLYNHLLNRHAIRLGGRSSVREYCGVTADGIRPPQLEGSRIPNLPPSPATNNPKIPGASQASKAKPQQPAKRVSTRLASPPLATPPKSADRPEHGVVEPRFVFKKSPNQSDPRARPMSSINSAEKLFVNALVAGVAQKDTLMLTVTIENGTPFHIVKNDKEDFEMLVEMVNSSKFKNPDIVVSVEELDV